MAAKQKTARAPTPDAVTRMDRPTFLEHRLKDLESDIRETRTARSFQALAALHRQSSAVQLELDRLRHPKDEAPVGPAEGTSDVDLVRELLAHVAQLPPGALEELADAIDSQRAGRAGAE